VWEGGLVCSYKSVVEEDKRGSCAVTQALHKACLKSYCMERGISRHPNHNHIPHAPPGRPLARAG
jgi:hypothetical protein